VYGIADQVHFLSYAPATNDAVPHERKKPYAIIGGTHYCRGGPNRSPSLPTPCSTGWTSTGYAADPDQTSNWDSCSAASVSAVTMVERTEVDIRCTGTEALTAYRTPLGPATGTATGCRRPNSPSALASPGS